MVQRAGLGVGIDLGTTYSSLAYVDAQGTARVVADSSGQAVLPSVVYFGDEGIVVGEMALEQARLHAERVVQFIKVHMGDPWRKELGGRVHTPESISAMILGQLLKEAEPQIGSITNAVITVPAYFTEKRRRATQQAGEIAGLRVTGTLNEPMAAALAYGLHHTQCEQIAVIYDLGGGTFDVTVVRTSPNEIQELATTGNRQLGGRDWDQVLVDYVATDFQKAAHINLHDDLQAMQDLLLECERAKRRLSRLNKTSIRAQSRGRDHQTEITREQFQGLTGHLLQATKLTTEAAVTAAGLKWSQIARVVLVGGSTQMPAVQHMLQELSGRPTDASVNPVLAVALGAAIYARMLESGQEIKTLERPAGVTAQASEATAFELEAEQPPPMSATVPKVQFVTAHGVGLKLRSGADWVNRVLIPKNTRVPASVTQQFVTRATGGGGRQVKIEITQGDATDLATVEVLGTGRIQGLPPDEPPGRAVDVTMQFDAQGRLHTHAAYVATGQEMQMSLDIPGGLQPADVAEHRRYLRQTGFLHPVADDELLRALDTDPAGDVDETEDFEDLRSVGELLQDLRVQPSPSPSKEDGLPFLEPLD